MGNINFKKLIRDANAGTGTLIEVYKGTNIWLDGFTGKYGVDVQCKDRTGKPIMKVRRKQFSSLAATKKYIDEQ